MEERLRPLGKIKSEREDIIRPTEYKVILLRTKDARSRALVSILYAYGKRISEVLALKLRDVQVSDKFIEIRFRILKRKPEKGILPMRTKRINLDHYTARYILEYLAFRDPDPYERLSPESWLFPGNKGNHLSRITAWKILKTIDQDIWPHLFRHSLATMIAENGATLWEIKAFFDWADARTAQKYVAETPEIAEKFMSRSF